MKYWSTSKMLMDCASELDCFMKTRSYLVPYDYKHLNCLIKYATWKLEANLAVEDDKIWNRNLQRQTIMFIIPSIILQRFCQILFNPCEGQDFYVVTKDLVLHGFNNQILPTKNDKLYWEIYSANCKCMHAFCTN